MAIDKTDIRQKNKLIRSQMTLDDVCEKSRLASRFFLSSEFYKGSACIMLYMPLGNEIDTSLIISNAFADNKKLVFPVTEYTTGEITPYCAYPDTAFKKGNFSVSEPDKTEIADTSEIDIVLVPGIAFDKYGSRVGFGKGCYDSFLKKTSAVRMGYCYSFQICDKINNDEFDIPMDYLISENGIIKCSKLVDIIIK